MAAIKITALFLALVTVMTVGIIAIANPNPELYTGYVYTRGEQFEDGMAKGYTWNYAGVHVNYTYSELQHMAETHRCSLQGFGSGEFKIGITLKDDGVAVLIPGTKELMELSDHWYLTF